MAIEFRQGDSISYDAPYFVDGSFSGSITAHVTASSASDAIAQLSAAYPTHPSASFMTQCSNDAAFVELIDCETRLYRVSIGYKFSNRGGGGTGEAGSLELASYDTVIEQRETYINPELWSIDTMLVVNSSHPMNKSPNGYEKRTVHVPIFRFLIPWNTETTLLTWAAGLSGSINSNAFSIGGRTWPPYSLRMNGVKEVVVKDSLGVIKHINIIQIDACNSGFLTDEPLYLTTGNAVVKLNYQAKTFTVPTPASIP
jgi:hypothetical protein